MECVLLHIRWSIIIEAEEQIIRELHHMPRQRYREILDFIKSIKKGPDNEALYVNESSLEKEWLRPEEDEAWANL